MKALKDFYLELVRRAVKLRPDMIYFGDDLGNQDRMPFSPRVFREVLFPAYREIFGFVRRHQGTPREIDAYVRETILELGSKRGGLMFTAGVYPDVPLRNIDALASAFEKYSKLHLEL